METGETYEEALHREILEEMAMDIRVVQHLITVEHEYPDFSITMVAYLCMPVADRTFTMNEHHSSQWLPPTQLLTLDWVAADVEIVNAISIS